MRGYINVGLGDPAVNRGSAMYTWKNVMDLG